MYYNGLMMTGDLIREARLRAGLTQEELGERIGRPQSVIARWERGAVTPSFETLREAIRGCRLDLSVSLAKLDESTPMVIEEHLKMSPAERFADLLERVRFHDRLQNREPVPDSV
jgi:transcriptional regulator with XRE-family HTH domain